MVESALCFTLRAAVLLDPQMVYRNPTRSIQASARKRLRAGIYESSIAPRNQSTVGSLLAGPGSTGDTLRLCTAGRAHVHMEDCRRSDPLVVATFCTRWPLISVRVLACCCLKYWSAQQRLTLFCVQISYSLKGHKASQMPPFNVWGSEGGSVLKARDFLDQQRQLLLGEILQGLGGRKGKKGMVCPLPTSRVYEVGICAVCAYCGEVYCTV